ncbi:16S rRNA (guanine(966)-N(2))-methyltransferase RsmD [Candidatus Pelagibacter sp.]|nr:16S rRNA (guanine(966)-N(2))-methyltransferase RsmD [Candidatus Pelagibacter sp.]
MRIISGYLKGRKIIQPNTKLTRPIKDLVKESIFNILEHSNLININIEKSEVLDLFSGVGSFGLECISRGSKSVIFSENYNETLDILKKNIIKLKCEDQTEIIEKNIFDIKYFDYFNKKKFNIIFLDPPYKEKKLSNLLSHILAFKLLKKNGIIIIHRHKKENEIFPKTFKVLKVKNYGISKVVFGN